MTWTAGFDDLRKATYQTMKITFLQIEQAFKRAVVGEYVRSIARDLGVTEGALRFHFRKGAHPKQVRRIAYALFYSEQAVARLDADSRRAVARLAR